MGGGDGSEMVCFRLPVSVVIETRSVETFREVSAKNRFVEFTRCAIQYTERFPVSPREILTTESPINLPAIPTFVEKCLQCRGIFSIELNSVEWKSAIKQYLREFKRRRKVSLFIRVSPPPARYINALCEGCVLQLSRRSCSRIVMRMLLGFLAG